jgi:hypothetical protein
MEKRRNFMGYAEITFVDGSKLTLTEDDFTVENNSVTDSAGANGIPLGVAVCKTVQLEIANPNDKYSDYDFFGSKFVFKIRYKLSETIESFTVGEFTVLDPYTYGETIILTAMDNMYKANDYYSTSMTFPATTRQILSDLCSNYDIPLGTTSFPNDDFVIDSRPAGSYLVRNLIGYIAMLSGGNARINRNGELEIVTYDFSVLDMFISGGSFKPWTEGEQISGGTLNPWTEGDELSGGEFAEKIPYHVFRKFKNLKVDTDDVVITGVQITIRNEDGTTTSLLKGEKGYVLEVENPLVSGKEEEAIELIGNALIGGHMRRFEGDHLAYPLAEFMDPCVVVDRKGNPYPTFLTDIDFNFFGFTTIKNTAESPGRKSVKYTPGYVKAIYEAQKLVEKERTDRELAVEQLNKTLASSSGMYSTDAKQEDGSTIRYLHDKKTLAESQNVIKVTSDAIGFSQDGGETYPYGITLDGQAVTKLLYAEGINADYLTTGIISDSSGNNRWDLIQGILEASNLAVRKSISTETIYCDLISNAAYPKTLISSPTIYVNADSGNDDQECENGAVFQTLQGAIDSIPKFLNTKYVYIEMQTDLKEDIDISGFVGGFIWIYLAGHTLYGRVNGYTTQHIRLYGGTIAGGGSDLIGIVHPPYSENNGSIVFNGCFNVYLSKLKIYGADALASGLNETNKVAIVAQGATYIYADEIEIVNTVRGVSSISAHIHMNKSYGIASETGFYCTTGGLITIVTNNQMGGSTRNTYTSNGGEIRYTGVTFETGNASSSTTTAPTIKVAKNVTYTSTKGNAIQYYGTSSAKWRSDNTPKQGTWGYGNHTAWWFFGSNFDNIANKEVTKVEITFTRNSGGNSSAVNHRFYVHSHKTQPSSVAPTYNSTLIGSADVATGNSKTITITNSSLIAAIKSGKGICAIPASQSKTYYSVMSGSMKVKFYYTE